MDRLKLILIIILIIALLIQGTLVFRDAIKNRIPFPWIWGILCLINIPSSLIIYLIFKKIYLKKKRR